MELRTDPRLSALEPRESWSSAAPFQRMRVKVKREIIRMDRPTIRPRMAGHRRSHRRRCGAGWIRVTMTAVERWCSFDTRNAFEVDHGSFAGAVDWRLDRFTRFPDAAATHRQELFGKTVVSYCTGGIRCEKAALYLREQGIDALQLDGGILGYFAAVGGAHWTGECFVFDERETLRPDLEPTRTKAIA